MRCANDKKDKNALCTRHISLSDLHVPVYTLETFQVFCYSEVYLLRAFGLQVVYSSPLIAEFELNLQEVVVGEHYSSSAAGCLHHHTTGVLSENKQT